jgi:hypothetical protein
LHWPEYFTGAADLHLRLWAMPLISRRAFFLTVAAAPAIAEANVSPVVVELFTSEGCSSCPPADRVLTGLVTGEIAPGIPVIALGEHVDYWDELGWKDRFSQHLFSERQQWYSNVFRGPYTPQMIVDGVTEFVGSEANKARAAVTAASKRAKASMSLQWGRSLEVRIQPLPGTHSTADVYFAITENDLSTDVGRGENHGRVLRHDGVVRTWKRVGVWRTGQQFSAHDTPEVKPDWNQKQLAGIAIAQDRESRRILAAASGRSAL